MSVNSPEDVESTKPATISNGVLSNFAMSFEQFFDDSMKISVI